MRNFEDNEQEHDVRRKKSKRASNRPGQGMRILNAHDDYDEEYYDYRIDIDDSVESEDSHYLTKR